MEICWENEAIASKLKAYKTFRTVDRESRREIANTKVFDTDELADNSKEGPDVVFPKMTGRWKKWSQW